jgi:putative lipase involved disintegration of autophagic bodies
MIFRGTEDAQNWLSDLDLAQRDYSACVGCRAHQGFLLAAHAILETVYNATAQLLAIASNSRLVVTGHSLGAAVATLIAVEFAKRGGRIPTLFTFGSPRLLNPPGAAYVSKLLGDEVNRYTYLWDIVVHVPSMSQGYLHVVGEWYEDKIGVDKCVGAEDKACADQWHIESLSFRDHLHYLNTTLICPAW